MLSWPAFRRSGPETSRLKWIAFWGETNEESSHYVKTPCKYKHKPYKTNTKDLRPEFVRCGKFGVQVSHTIEAQAGTAPQSLLASRHSGEFRMSGVWRLSPGLSLSNSSALGCQLNISDHLGRWHMPQPMSTPTCNASVLLNNLFQAVPSFNSKKERPETSNIETLHLPPSGCIRTNIIPWSKDWTNGRPFSKVYIWPHTNYFENEKSLQCLEHRETSNIDLRGGYRRSC